MKYLKQVFIIYLLCGFYIVSPIFATSIEFYALNNFATEMVIDAKETNSIIVTHNRMSASNRVCIDHGSLPYSTHQNHDDYCNSMSDCNHNCCAVIMTFILPKIQTVPLLAEHLSLSWYSYTPLLDDPPPREY